MDAAEPIISRMQDTINSGRRVLTLDLALTVRHDGHGGVADDLADPVGLTAWVRDHAETLPDAVALRRRRGGPSRGP